MASKKGGKKGGKKGKKEAAKKVEEEEAPKVEKFPGLCSLYLGDKELQRYGLKTGDGILDVAAYKIITKEFITEEISFMGKMSAFEPYRAKFEAYEDESVLFVWDPDEEKQQDCNFFFCSSPETFAEYKEKLGISDDGDGGADQLSKEEQEEEERRQREEEERIAEEERIQKAIAKLRQPLIPRPWKDLGSEKEILDSRITRSRPLINIRFSRARREFGKNCQFSDQENIDGMNVEIRSSAAQSLNYDTYRRVMDMGSQCGDANLERSTQTQWYRKQNRIIQYEFNDDSLNPKEKQLLKQANKLLEKNDDNEWYLDEQDEKEAEISPEAITEFHRTEERLVEFLDSVVDECEDILTDNTLVDIFKDEFAGFEIDEESITVKTENIKEIQTFVDLNWSRDKKISCIQWMPDKDSNIVAVSCIENMPFDQRVEIMNKSRLSTILLWNLNHVLLKAQTICTAPTDIFVFRFHPTKPHILVGGLETGQVALWDLRSAQQSLQSSTQRQQQQSKSSNTENNNSGADESDQKQSTSNESTNELGIALSSAQMPSTVPLSTNNKRNHSRFDFDDEEKETVPRIAPKMISFIEKSHTKSVTDILWLPNDMIINKKGELEYIDLSRRANNSKTNAEEQFMSISGDGKIYFWSLEEPVQTEKEKKKGEEAKWMPITSAMMNHSTLRSGKGASEESNDNDADMDSGDAGDNDDDASEAPANNAFADSDELHFDESGQYPLSGNVAPKHPIFGCRMCQTPLIGQLVIGTELGEFSSYTYAPMCKDAIDDRGAQLLQPFLDAKSHFYDTMPSSNNNAQSNDNEEQPNAIETLQMSLKSSNYGHLFRYHCMSVNTVQMSPHFADTYLTVGDWTFCIWKLGLKNPLVFQSPFASTYLTCGVWSPTRPAVIIIAKVDGSIDIWDLLDQTHAPVIANSPITSVAITAMVFSSIATSFYSQQMGVGDENGNLRILEIPRNVAVPLSNEKVLMAQFYEREKDSIEFTKQRNKIHRKVKLEHVAAEKLRKEQMEKSEGNDDGMEEKEAETMDESKNDKKMEAEYQKKFQAFKAALNLS